jgi:hypothetical protein
MSASSDLISKEFASLFAAVSPSDEERSSADVIGGAADHSRASADTLGGVVSAAGSRNVQNAPSNSGVGSPQSQKTGGSSALSEVTGLAEGLLGPIPSIISDIAGIFGGGGTKAAPVFAKYELPASIDFQGTVDSSRSLDASDTNQFGDPRDLVSISAPLAGGMAGGTFPSAPPTALTAPPAGGGPTTPAQSGHTFNQTFNMQAFDGDGMASMSDQIAASVRRALLTSNALGDVITNDLS